MKAKLLVAFLVGTILAASTAVVFASDQNGNLVSGAVYAMTNASDDNRVVIFDRNEDGLLTLAGSVSTEGLGSGGDLDPLASQGALVLTHDKRWLLAVNAGSNEISVFRVSPGGVKLVDKVDSGGDFPVSVTTFHNLVYVLNAKGEANITGFSLDHRGQLVHLNNSTRLLGTGGFAQVGFDPKGRNLVITDRDDGEILVFSINRWGLPRMDPVTTTSNGAGPFGFIFDPRGHLLVSEAGSGAVSSYAVFRDDTLGVISPSVENFQVATCWIALNANGYVFTANTGSQTISAYRLVPGKRNHQPGERGRGTVVLLDETAAFGNRPLDLDVAGNGRYLYALDPAEEAIDMFAIEADGSLTDLGTIAGGLSIFAQGIAAR